MSMYTNNNNERTVTKMRKIIEEKVLFTILILALNMSLSLKVIMR